MKQRLAIKNERIVFQLFTDLDNKYFSIKKVGQKRILAGSKNADRFLITKSYLVNKKEVDYNKVLDVVVNDYIDLMT